MSSKENRLRTFRQRIKWLIPYRNWFASSKKIEKIYFSGNLITFTSLYCLFWTGVSYFPEIKLKIFLYLLFFSSATFLILKLLKINLIDKLRSIDLISPKRKIKFLYLKFKRTKKTNIFCIELGVLILFFCLTIFLITKNIAEINIKNTDFLNASIFGILICSFSLLIEIFSFFKKNNLVLFGKIFQLTAIAPASFISLIISREYINSITHINPVQLPLALALLSSFVFLFVWILLMYLYLLFIFSFLYVLTPVLTFFWYFPQLVNLFREIQNNYLFRFIFRKSKVIIEEKQLRYFGLYSLWFGRSLGVCGMLITLIQLNSVFPLSGMVYLKNEGNLHRFLASAIVLTNYQVKSDECTNVGQSERVAPISDRKISVAIPDKIVGYKFKVRSCKFP